MGRTDWLGSAELRVGLGCMRLSTDADRDEERAVATVAAAADAGISVFDRAPPVTTSASSPARSGAPAPRAGRGS